MSDQTTIRVFLVDDHPLVRDGVRSALEASGGLEVVGEAGTVEEALARVPAAAPDVAIVDLHLPDGSGVEICRTLADAEPPVRSLVLTTESDDEALFDSVLAGAVGYVLKQVHTDELVSCVRRAAAGEPLIDERSRQQIHARIKQGTSDPRLSQLSPQEMALLEHLTEGLTNREISRRMHLSEKTVKNYMSNLLLKLGMERRTEAAVYGSRALERRDAARRQAERLPSAIRY